jgi:2-methylcitrate dehydratase PrpD
VRDPRDPRSFDQSALCDPDISSLAQRVQISVAEKQATPLAATVTITLQDGRVLTRTVTEFKGTPQQPLESDELRQKFALLTRHCPAAAMEEMFERLRQLENEPDLDWIEAARQ